MRLKTNRSRGAWFWIPAGLLALALAACSGEQLPPDTGIDGNDGGDIDCPVACSNDEECCGQERCLGGVCTLGGDCPQGCNWECNKAAGEICNQATKKCETGVPPVNCQDGCNCYAGESCINAQCTPFGGDEPPCIDDDNCEDGEVCREGLCRPESCVTREDCGGGDCLVCQDGQCTAPPPVCQGDDDCCVGYRCNFGTCIPVDPGCTSDSNCLDPDFPRCIPPDCFPECLSDIDCPLPGQICINTHCESPGCTPEQCAQGQWCNTGTGECEPGCDSNDDCMAPDTCNYATHTCGQVDCCGGVCTPGDQYCDEVTCQCVNPCQGPDDCPPNYNCNLGTGKCMCTAAACSAGFHCDPVTGMCMPDANECDPNNDQCPAGQHCDPGSLVCVPDTGGGNGDPCMTDAECSAGLLCDNAIFCIPCMMIDPDFFPTYTCRYECSLIDLQCSISGYECKMRRLLVGQCMPP